MRHLFCLCSAAILYYVVCSCQTAQGIVIKVGDSAGTLSQKQTFYFPQYVLLEENSTEAAIRHVNKVLFLNDRIIISDCLSNKIVLFDGTGKYLGSTAGMIGKGNNEYVHFLDCAVDCERQLIYMLCDFPYQFMVFDANLVLQRCIRTNDYMSEFTLDGNYLYAFCKSQDNPSSYELRRYQKSSPDGKYTVLLTFDKGIRGVKGMGYSLCGSDDNICFSMPFSNDIYEIKDGNIHSRISIDFGKDWFSYEDSRGLSGRRFIKKNDEVNWTIQNIVTSDSVIYFNTNNVPFFRIDKAAGTCGSYKYFGDTYFPYGSSWITPCYGKAGYMVQTIPAETVRDYVRRCEEKDMPVIPAIKDLAVTDSTNNPVLQILRFR